MNIPVTYIDTSKKEPTAHDPVSQCSRILKRLKDKPGHSLTNVELNHMGIYRYSARIADLRHDGHVIVSNHLKDGLWEFTLLEDAA